MALLDVNKFAALCRTTVAIIRTNKARGKVVFIGKKIDTDYPLNEIFFDKYNKKAIAESKKVKERENIESLYDDVVEKTTKQVKEQIERTTQKQSRQRSAKKVGWEARKIKADAMLQEKKAEA